jgi:hypothetical protein
MLRSSNVLGPPARRVNSIRASPVVKRALRGNAVRMHSVLKKITSQAFQYRKDIPGTNPPAHKRITFCLPKKSKTPQGLPAQRWMSDSYCCHRLRFGFLGKSNQA